MRANEVRRRLAGGDVSIGTFVFEFASNGVGRLAAEAGAEFVIFDMEHTGWGIETIRDLIATTRVSPIVPLVRVPACEYDFVARSLDMGAMGVMVPMVETVEQAQILADSSLYPPAGRRGAAFGMCHDDYSGGPVPEKQAEANENRLAIAQVETAKGVENVEAIAGVEGIDMIWVGQTDLTTSLGIPGEFDHPRFIEALDHVAKSAAKQGKSAGYMAMSVAEAQQRVAQGFRAIAYANDIFCFKTALESGLSELRGALSNG